MLHKSKINSNHKTLLAGAVAQATAKIGEEHKEQTGTLQQLADRLTALMGQPLFIVALFMAILVWVVGNLTVVRLGYAPIDPPPFIWLQGTITTSTLFIAVLILTTQRREDQLANHRLQLILELTILNDQRSSKIIELLEEVRRDNPAIFDRVDNEAAAMSVPSDTLAVLEAIKDSGTKL